MTTTAFCSTCKYLDLTERKPGPDTGETFGMCRFPAPVVQAIPAGIIFSVANKPVFSITGDGRLEAGEGLSNDESTRALFDCISRYLPCFLTALRERAEKAEAELERVREELFGGGFHE